MPMPLTSRPSTPSTLIQCVIRTSATCRGGSLVPTAASTLASLIMTLSTRSFCHHRSKKESQQYKFEHAQFANDRKDTGPFTHASPVYGTFSYTIAPYTAQRLNDSVIDASGSCFDVSGAEYVNTMRGFLVFGAYP